MISGTKEKSELLRNIFNTGLYDLALQRLKGRVSKMSGDYERVRMQYQAQCAMLKAEAPIVCGEFPSVEEVEKIAQVAQSEEEKIIGFNQQVRQADMAYKMAIDDLNKQKQHNEDVRKWQEALAHKERLAQRSESINQLKQRVIEAEKAEPVMAKEARFLEAQAQLYVLQQGLEESEMQCAQLSEQCKAANDRHRQALDEKQQADSDFQKVPALSNKLARLQHYMQKKAALVSAQHTYKEMNDKKVVTEQALNSLSEQLQKAEAALQNQQRLHTERSEKQVLLMELKQTLQEEEDVLNLQQLYWNDISACKRRCKRKKKRPKFYRKRIVFCSRRELEIVSMWQLPWLWG